jgi:hypothetical protein
MTNPTSNFGWQMPEPTDLVTNLPADFEVFGQAVDTSMADLKGGTTGQILSKATNTDMDFAWIANDQGDITGVTATSPITGGGTSGAISIGIQDATTSVKGAVQLSDSTSTTSSVLASTPTAVKSAYDLATTANTTANAAIAKTTVTTAGDIIYRNATVPTRLGIGTAGQVLTVNSGATAPEWGTAAGGGMTLLSTTTLSGASTSISITPTGYTTLQIYLVDVYTATNDVAAFIRLNGASGNNYIYTGVRGDTTIGYIGQNAINYMYYLFNTLPSTSNSTKNGQANITIFNPTGTGTHAVTWSSNSMANASAGPNFVQANGTHNTGAAISSISFTPGSGNWSGGTVYVYGVK